MAALDEAHARALALRALDQLGGPRAVYRSPRHPFSLAGTRTLRIDEYEVRVRYGEISAPAVVELAGFVFEIRDEELILLFAPPER
ncbi:protein-L-isoaspartate o-methyltransferase 1 [Thermomicrobium sp. 4228-Ro]|uniref:protein-L-isoaspartate o-methyltransferase 1 n=1 Tax=Thermomicrobium sp. 4228-Ro TaxID=2993937 RepID=UPI0022489A05|nr:protein-L-isoaspartate o-methyltransferase 1 [Thermomicrobium sp. 4228-Ro]MCX2728440.1 protein-L-isoaspartate o-methyltransferase 1 [Thermomicrobium sp. 4228-Ro]